LGGVGTFGVVACVQEVAVTPGELLADADLIHYTVGASEKYEEELIRKAVDFSTTTRRQTTGGGRGETLKCRHADTLKWDSHEVEATDEPRRQTQREPLPCRFHVATHGGRGGKLEMPNWHLKFGLRWTPLFGLRVHGAGRRHAFQHAPQ
jgi:hypothetical protein